MLIMRPGIVVDEKDFSQQLSTSLVLDKFSASKTIPGEQNPQKGFLFPELKEFLSGKQFGSDVELKEVVLIWMDSLTADEYNIGIENLVSHCNKCLDNDGDCVESFGPESLSKSKMNSPLAEKMNDLNESQTQEKERMNKKMNLVESEVSRLKEELREKMKAQEDELEKEKVKSKMESVNNKQQVENLEKKLKEIMEEKEKVMKEYELKIADSTKKEEELQKMKDEMMSRHQTEREELENKCKAEMDELKRQLEKSESENHQMKEWQTKYEEIKNILLESELEQQRLFEAKVEVETKVIDLTNYGENQAEQVKELELKMKESEEIVEKVRKEMEGLEEDIMCSICAEIFIEPTALQCGHVFCKLCITEWSKKKKICPMCRAKLSTTVRIFTMDSMIQRNIRLMSEEAQARREALIAERKKGKTPQKKRSAKKMRLEEPSQGPSMNYQGVNYGVLPDHLRQMIPQYPRVIPAVVNRIHHNVQPVNAARALDSEGVDPFQLGWVTSQLTNLRPVQPERSSPVTVAAIDLTNMSVAAPVPEWPRTHTVTSADANSTIDLTNM